MMNPTHSHTETQPIEGLWRSIRNLWCRHTRTTTTPRVNGMPAHIVCLSCGWREPVQAAAPQATRTWDSTRDEARYQLEKKRRVAVEEQRLQAEAKLAGPTPRRPRRPRGTVLQMKRAVGE